MGILVCVCSMWPPEVQAASAEQRELSSSIWGGRGRWGAWVAVFVSGHHTLREVRAAGTGV